MARFISRERTLFKSGENNFYETKVYYADSTVFKVFDHRFVEGSAGTALNAPFDIVIIKSLAEKYFGRNSPAVVALDRAACGEDPLDATSPDERMARATWRSRT